MPARTSYIAEEERLDLSFEGNLDVTVSEEVCAACKRVTANLKSCIIDLTAVDRLFDSGAALLQMLHKHLREYGTTVVILSDRPEITDRLATLTAGAWHISPLHRA
jgi:anti-anti-sigma regulatory factor